MNIKWGATITPLSGPKVKGNKMFNLSAFDKYVDAALEVAQIFIKLEAMKAANHLRQEQDKAQAYDEYAFMALHERINGIRKRLDDNS